MAYIYEQDVTKVGGNLQKTVAYLLSLHKNEYEWNLLGIRVIGVKEALPIPDGTYDYGDAYMIGNKTDGFELGIYTRADEFHSEAYWFDVGKFPKPGPKGDKGDGIEAIDSATTGTVQDVDYNITGGSTVTSQAAIKYTDSTDGTIKTQDFQLISILPIKPGKYISMDATADKQMMEVNVDDTKLSLDYWKIKKESFTVPIWAAGFSDTRKFSSSLTQNTFAYRDEKGNCTFNGTLTNYISDPRNKSENNTSIGEISHACKKGATDITVTKTSTDNGTLDVATLSQFQDYPQLHIQYNNQTYYRMDPLNAPNGTLNFIHIDSIDDGNGGYKATGKCFSVTVSTREWQVYDLDFGGSTRTTHNLTLTNSSTGTNIYFSLTNNRPETYEGAPAGLLEALQNSSIACTVDSNGTYSAGMITTDGTNFQVTYGNGEQLMIEQMQVSIADSLS